MKYDISKKSVSAMSNLGKGTESIKILLSQTSFARNFVAKWPNWLQKVGVIKNETTY